MLNSIAALNEVQKKSKIIKIKLSNETIDVNNRINNEWVLIEFHDNGCGIEKENSKMIYKPGVSFKNGTGLGLSISQTLIHQHHGKLSCISSPGHTEFTILLPLSE